MKKTKIKTQSKVKKNIQDLYLEPTSKVKHSTPLKSIKQESYKQIKKSIKLTSDSASDTESESDTEYYTENDTLTDIINSSD
jgi:hypothetical protein